MEGKGHGTKGRKGERNKIKDVYGRDKGMRAEGKVVRASALANSTTQH